ncbi:hypothetical protein [Helicobacter cetorum]|uniref:Uncharacterized protein n=1 Tax=Helicobacter cetorum (strain ATCC BAA-429 / MIT 00-7128) TaxID=182217 RepID=I0ELL8_HELC0|nr:hypothetical protein [Helicobacter cetorum]AFI03837.1 hypothetical protein HCW_02780 [Helicobacter cetorum MIT 00-7128]
MKNLIERFFIIFHKGEKVNIEIKIDTMEKLKEYIEQRAKIERLKAFLLFAFFVIFVVSVCVTCAYIFKGF